MPCIFQKQAKKYYLADFEVLRMVLRRIHAYGMFCRFEQRQMSPFLGLQQFISASVQIGRA